MPAQGGEDSARVREAVERLETSEHGKQVLAAALSFWKLRNLPELTTVVEPGPESKTDAVLTRRFDPQTGVESRERSVVVYLRLAQAPEDVVLDLAHELVHATARAAWDPYDPALTAGKYIHSAIEGEGGEVDAVALECKVALDLFPTRAQTSGRCGRYLGVASRQISRDRVKEDFYRVGGWMPELRRTLGAEIRLFPVLRESAPRLFSSTGHAPYPVALYREYTELTRVACENTRRRTSAQARAPASLEGSRPGPDAFLTQRCQ
jgi:hypothetical protein